MPSALQFYDVLEDFAHKAVLGQPGPLSADIGVLCSKETLIMVRRCSLHSWHAKYASIHIRKWANNV